MNRKSLNGLVAGLVALTVSAQAATNFLYDAYVTPNTLPTAIAVDPWVTDGAGKAGDSQTATGNLLTVVDNSSSSLPSYYYYHSLGAAVINSTDQYEAIARVRVPSSGDLLGEGRGPFYLRFIDGTRIVGIGVTDIGGGSNRVFFTDSTLKPLNTGGGPRYDDVVIGGSGFLNLRLVKQGTSGGIGDTVRLYVENVEVESDTYIVFPALAARDVLFGSSSSPGFGTFELTGVSFGIGQQAELITGYPIPEPSVAGLLLAGGLLVMRKTKACR